MKKVLYTSKNTNMLLYDADTDKPFGRLDTAHLRELSGKVVIVAAADEAGRWVFDTNEHRILPLLRLHQQGKGG